MPDYEKLYHDLFNKMTDLIEEMKKIQQDAEEVYIAAGENNEEEKQLSLF